MAKIHKLTKGGQTIYPATITDAVVHPELKVSTSELIEEINISRLFPTGGTSGGNKYTLETAIAKIPARAIKAGMKCSFFNLDRELETWEYSGGAYIAVSNWVRVNTTNAIIIEWQSSFATTVLQISSKQRKPGLIITYKDSEGKWVIKEFVGETTVDNVYADEKNWKDILTTTEFNEIVKKIETPKYIIDSKDVLADIDSVRPQSNLYPYPFDKLNQGKAYRTFRASQVTDIKSIISDAYNVEVASTVMRAKSSKGNSFNCVFQIEGTVANTIQITSEWTTFVVNSKNAGGKQMLMVPSDDIDVQAIYVLAKHITTSEVDDGSIERLAIDRFRSLKDKVWDTLNLYKYNISMMATGKWSAKGMKSSNLFRMPDVLTIIHKPIITGGAQRMLCFDADMEFISVKNIKNYVYQNVKKEELPEGTEYISIFTNDFRTSGDVEDMFVCEGYFPFIETKGAYNYKEDEQLIKTLVPIGKNVLTDISRFSTQPQAISGYNYLISINSQITDTTALMSIDGNSISVSGLKTGVTSAVVYFYNSDLTSIIRRVSLVASDGEFKGIVTVPTGAAMFAVAIGHVKDATIDYSEFQIEFGDKVTNYEKPVFGVKNICNYPVSSNASTVSDSSLSLNIGTVFIFGDSITATNKQASLEGSPEDYPNDILTISWVPDVMSKLSVSKWYNFALGGATWTDVGNPSSFAQMSTQVNKAVSFSQSSDVVPDLVIVAMGANNNYRGDAEADFDLVMHQDSDSAYGYEGIPYEDLDRTQLPQAIRWNLHTLEEKFPNAVKLLLTPPQSANRDYITDAGENQKIRLIELFANAYCFEVIPQHKEAGIVRQFETTGKNESGAWQNTRDLVDQVHPNANGRYKIARYLVNKIAARFML